MEDMQRDAEQVKEYRKNLASVLGLMLLLTSLALIFMLLFNSEPIFTAILAGGVATLVIISLIVSLD